VAITIKKEIEIARGELQYKHTRAFFTHVQQLSSENAFCTICKPYGLISSREKKFTFLV